MDDQPASLLTFAVEPTVQGEGFILDVLPSDDSGRRRYTVSNHYFTRT